MPKLWFAARPTATPPRLLLAPTNNLFDIFSTLEWGGTGSDCHRLTFRNSFPPLSLHRRSGGKAWLAGG